MGKDTQRRAIRKAIDDESLSDLGKAINEHEYEADPLVPHHLGERCRTTADAVVEPDANGDTPLHDVARSGDEDFAYAAAEIILSANLEAASCRNHLNQLPVDVAVDDGSSDPPRRVGGGQQIKDAIINAERSVGPLKERSSIESHCGPCVDGNSKGKKSSGRL